MKVEVLLPIPVDYPIFTYKIAEYLGQLKVGQFITVPVRNRILPGIIWKINPTNISPHIKYKEINEIISPQQLFSSIHIDFYKWVASYYMTSLGNIVKTAIPAKLHTIYKQTEITKLITYIKLHSSLLNKTTYQKELVRLKNAPQQKKFLEYLYANYKKNLLIEISQHQLLEAGFNITIVKNLIKKNMVFPLLKKEEKALLSYTNFPPLNKKNKDLLKDVNSKFLYSKVVLLQHIDTEKKILIHLIKRQLIQNKTVIYLHPNIASLKSSFALLFPFFKGFVYQYIAANSLKVKCTIWKKIHTGKEAMLILGIRSLLLLPFRNIGLIIIHNEHSWTHKQVKQQPFFHTRDAAIMYAKFLDIKVLLHEITPSFESYRNLKKNKYAWVQGNVSKNIQLKIIDTKEAKRKKQLIGEFSPTTIKQCKEILDKGKSVIIFKNRLGFSHYLKCNKCSFVPFCPSCQISLTFHKDSSALRCHFCAYYQDVNSCCFVCKKGILQPKGYGIKRLLEYIQELFPSQKAAYLDSSFSNKKIKNCLQKLKNAKIKILLASKIEFSQICFQNVGVVVLLDYDDSINYPNFRAEERSMQQISHLISLLQKNSILLIQTSQPDSELLYYLKNENFESFLQSRYLERKQFNCPPFFRWIELLLQHNSEKMLSQASQMLIHALKNIKDIQIMDQENPLHVNAKMNNKKLITVQISRKLNIKEIKNSIIACSSEIIRKHPALQLSFNVDP